MSRFLTAASALFAVFALQSLAAAESPAEAEQCYSDYKLATQLTDYAPDAWEATGGIVTDNYNERLYRSGKALSPAKRTDLDQAAYDKLLTIDLFDALDGSDQTVRDTRNRISACDITLGIPETAVRTPVVEDLECATRYATMSLGYQIPAQKIYFNKRMQMAIERDAYHLGMLGLDPSVQKDVAAAAIVRVKQNFGADGQPDFANLQKSFLKAQECDRQYTQPLTPIPPQVTDAASGKSE